MSEQSFSGGVYTEHRCYCGKYMGMRYSGIICDRCGGEVIERNGLVRYIHELRLAGAELLYRRIFGDEENEAEVFLPISAFALREVIINSLEPKEIAVLGERYGLFSDSALDLEFTNLRLDISEAQVKEIEAAAMRKLRHPSPARKLKDYIHYKDADSHNGETQASDMTDSHEDLQLLYKQHKERYDRFVQENIARGNSSNTSELFSYLCFNLLLGPVDADVAENAVRELNKKDFLSRGDADKIKMVLKQCGYRFANRADWICENRTRFAETNSEIGIVSLVHGLRSMNPVDARNLLVNNVKGLGMKAASHFLRGLGLSNNELAILDVYILEWLDKFGVVEHLPRDPRGRIRHPTNGQYLRYEKLMKDWNNSRVHIPLDILDLLLWERGRGDI